LHRHPDPKVYIPSYSCGLYETAAKLRGITDLGEAGLRVVAGNGDFFVTPIFFLVQPGSKPIHLNVL